MPRILCIDTEPSTVQSLQAAGHEVATGEMGYRTGVPVLSNAPHEFEAIVCDLREPACYDSLDWGPGRNDNFRCKIVKAIPLLAQLLDGQSRPRYRIIEATQLPKLARGMFGPADLLRAVGEAGIPIFFFLNPEWLRHVSFESPNFFGIRWRFNPTRAIEFSVAKPLAQLLAKFDGPVSFRTPIQYEIAHAPRFTEKPNFAQWFPLLTNTVNQVFGQILQVGKGYIWSIPACHDNAALIGQALNRLREFKAGRIAAAFEKSHGVPSRFAAAGASGVSLVQADSPFANLLNLSKSAVPKTQTALRLEDFDEFKLVERISREDLGEEVLKNVRNLDERKQIEVFIREIIGDRTKTPHGPTEIVDIRAELTCRGQRRRTGFVIKGKSEKHVTAKNVSHQILRPLNRLPRLDVIVLLAVTDIQDDAVEVLEREAEKVCVAELIVRTEDVARLLIAYNKICPKDGVPYSQGRCPKCG